MDYKNIESKIFESLAIEQAYEKARLVLKKQAIQMDNFRDLYGDESVEKDKKYVKKMEEIFSKDKNPEGEEAEKLAKVFEVIFYEQAELNEWLGSNVSTIISSRYDDIKSGVDSIAEFRESDTSASYLALAVDVTTGGQMVKKFMRIKKEITEGKLVKIKYFASEHMGIRGELSRVPRAVVGVSAATVKEISELWLERKNKELSQHAIQFQILEEIVQQLEIFQKYAESVNQPALASIYKKTYNLVEKIYQGKKESIKDSDNRDDVFYNIKSIVQSLFRA